MLWYPDPTTCRYGTCNNPIRKCKSDGPVSPVLQARRRPGERTDSSWPCAAWRRASRAGRRWGNHLTPVHQKSPAITSGPKPPTRSAQDSVSHSWSKLSTKRSARSVKSSVKSPASNPFIRGMSFQHVSTILWASESGAFSMVPSSSARAAQMSRRTFSTMSYSASSS